MVPQSELQFHVHLETDKKASWRPQEAEKPDGVLRRFKTRADAF